LGIDCSPADYVTKRYVGASQGSTPEEVAAIVRDAGAEAHILSGLSTLDLRGLDAALIANVRGPPTSSQYNHWVVARFQDREVWIYDGTGGPVRMPVADFLGVWSGLGIVVTKAGSDLGFPFWLGRLLILQVGIVFALVLRVFRERVGDSLRRGVLTIFATAAATAAIGLPLMADLANYSRGVRVAVAPFVADSFRKGTLETLRAATADPRCLLIDARFERDYGFGSLPRAVNVPVNASLWRIREFLRDIDRDTPIVVFCQSSSCDFDETVGRQLTLLGFRDVTVTREGYAEFRRASAAADHTSVTDGE
jgi:rhodanese-related sulfurtransferase